MVRHIASTNSQARRSLKFGTAAESILGTGKSQILRGEQRRLPYLINI